MDLNVEFMGLSFRNPILASAGPLTSDYERIKNIIEAGIGGVVVKTIKETPEKTVPRPRLRGFELELTRKRTLLGLQNIEGYSDHPIEKWETWLSQLKKEYPQIPIIVSLTSTDPKTLAQHARRIEEFGADAVQLDLSCPHHFKLGTGTGSTNPDLTTLYVSEVRNAIKIPIMHKLTYNVTDIVEIARASKEAGANAVVPIDTVRSFAGIDIEQGKPLLPTCGGLSGPAIRPLALYSVISIAKELQFPISASGGIMSWRHIVEFMMAGATTVQLNTAVMFEGYSVIQEALEGLQSFLEKHNYSGPNDIIGLALHNLLPTVGDVPHRPGFEISVDVEKCARNCNICIDSCQAGGYSAITRGERSSVIDVKKCDGCGLCTVVCPTGAIRLQVN